jgi:hypothetical protein
MECKYRWLSDWWLEPLDILIHFNFTVTNTLLSTVTYSLTLFGSGFNAGRFLSSGLRNCTRLQLAASNRNSFQRLSPRSSLTNCNTKSKSYDRWVSRPVCFGVRHLSGALDQTFITVRHLWVWCCGEFSLTEVWVCSYTCYWSSPAQSLSGPNLTGFTTLYFCLRFETPSTCRYRSPYLHPKEQESPVILPDAGLPSRPLLRLVGLRWRYSNRLHKESKCNKVKVKVTLQPIISRPVRLGVRLPSGTRDHFFYLLEIFF